MTTSDLETSGIDADRLRRWLSTSIDPTATWLAASRIGGGNSSGAWLLDIESASGSWRWVLKSPNDGGLVFDCDASREGRILQAAGHAGAPVPAIVAIDETGEQLGQPSFVMEFVEGRSVPEDTPASFHGDGWFRDAPSSVQEEVWCSFIDALAELHATDVSAISAASHGAGGVADVLGYWRRSLLDAAPAHLVPRQLAIIDWLVAHVPAGADDDPALCMGDARLGNAILDGNKVRALLDFEVAYIGNPAADVGYCITHEVFTRLLSDRPATGMPGPDETWKRWEAATGRRIANRDYWTAFGATIMCVTGTRAMLKWGMPVETVDTDNIVVNEWEALIQRAAG